MTENLLSEKDAGLLSKDQKELVLAVASNISEIGFKSLLCVFIDGATRLMGIDSRDELVIRSTARRLRFELAI